METRIGRRRKAVLAAAAALLCALVLQVPQLLLGTVSMILWQETLRPLLLAVLFVSLAAAASFSVAEDPV